MVIMRSDTHTRNRGRISFVLIGCERSGKYKVREDLVRIVTGSRKCECLFKLRVKPMVKGEGWIMKLICGSNHMCGKNELFSSLEETVKSSVKFGNNANIPILGKGQITIRLEDGSQNFIFDVFYALRLLTTY